MDECKGKKKRKKRKLKLAMLAVWLTSERTSQLMRHTRTSHMLVTSITHLQQPISLTRAQAENTKKKKKQSVGE